MVTPIFHNFWAYGAEDPQHMMQTINFMKNAGLAGGLLMVLAYGFRVPMRMPIGCREERIRPLQTN